MMLHRSLMAKLFLTTSAKATTCILIILMTAACSRPFTEYVAQPVGKFFDWDTEVEVSFTVESNVNPDDSNNNQPSPLVVRIYELSATEVFEQAKFRDIYLKDKETLGGDFIKKHTLKALLPGSNRTDTFYLKKGTAYVGLFAEFSQFKNADDRIIIPVDSYLTTRQDVRLSYQTIKLIRQSSGHHLIEEGF